MPNIEDFLRRKQEIIDKVGWAVMHVLPNGDDPDDPHDPDDPDATTPFAYTVGLTAHGYPELFIAGLAPGIAHALLNDLAGRVYDQAKRFTHGQRVSDLIAGYDAIIVEGPVIEALPPMAAIARYGRDQIRLQQIVWPDRQGRFPWQDGYDLDPHTQPLIAHP
jgi:hypothetical protein